MSFSNLTAEQLRAARVKAGHASAGIPSRTITLTDKAIQEMDATDPRVVVPRWMIDGRQS